MNRIILAVALVMPAVSFAASSQAVAQEQVPSKRAADSKKSDVHQPVGARVGSFGFFPDLKVEQVYDDNYYKKKTNGDKQHYTTVKPSVSLRSDWNSHALRLDASVEHGEFWGATADNYDHADVRVRGKIDVTKATNIRLEGQARMLTEARGGDDVASDAADPTEYVRQNASVSFNHKSNRVSLSGGVEANRYDYDDSATIGGSTTNNDDRDRMEHKVTGRVGYEIQKGYEGFVRAEYGLVDYKAGVDDAGANRDSDGYKIEGGLALQLSKLLRGDVGVGWLSRSFDDTQFKEFSALAANGNLIWSATSLTDVRVFIGREVNETTTSGTSATLLTSYGIGVAHEFLRNLKAKAELKFTTTDYEGDTTTNREDDQVKASVGLSYDVNRNIYCGASYTYEERDSNVVVNDYDRNIYKVSVGLRF